MLVIQLSPYYDISSQILRQKLRKSFFLPAWEAGRISFGVGPEGG